MDFFFSEEDLCRALKAKRPTHKQELLRRLCVVVTPGLDFNSSPLRDEGSWHASINTLKLQDGPAMFPRPCIRTSSVMHSNSAISAGGGIFNNTYGTVTVKNSSTITGNTAPIGGDVDNLGVLYQDLSGIIGFLAGNPAQPI